MHEGGWKGRLADLLKKHNHLRANGSGSASHKTRAERSEALYRSFRDLRELKFGIEDPHNLKPKHIEALAKHWQKQGLSVGTIDNNLSYLRTLSVWIGKPGLVKSREEYLPGMKRTYAADHDKSFAGNQVDFGEVLHKVSAMDVYVGMQLLLIKAFGLRRKEAVMMKPFVADRGQYLEVFDGTKGGRPRTVPIATDFQREVLAEAKNFVLLKKGNAKGHVGHPERTLDQNLKRYSYVMTACGITREEAGVTGHGLRAEYAMDELEKRGIISTLRGGTGSATTRLDSDIAYLQVSEQLGHSRKSVIAAYAGRWITPPASGLDTEKAS